MSITNLAAAYILILLISISLFAQNQGKVTPDNSEQRPFGSVPLLPQKPDAWSAVIVSSGGILGTSQTVAAVSSDGNFLCEKKGYNEKNVLGKESIAKLFSLTEKLPAINRFNFEGASPVQYCNDCIVYTLVLSRRSKDASYLGQYRYRVFPVFSAEQQTSGDADINEVAMRIFQETLRLTDCNSIGLSLPSK